MNEGGVSHGTHEEVKRNLRHIFDRLYELAEKISETPPRTDKKLALLNIVKMVGSEVRHIELAAEDTVDVLAWHVRNVFELDVILRHILTSEAALSDWFAQMATDEIEMLKGALGMHNATDSPEKMAAGAQLTRRIEEIRGILARHDLAPAARHFNIREIAVGVGLGAEYRAIYKIASKYTHPTSYVVNSVPDRGILAWQMRTIFLHSGAVVGRGHFGTC